MVRRLKREPGVVRLMGAGWGHLPGAQEPCRRNLFLFSRIGFNGELFTLEIPPGCKKANNFPIS